MLNRAKYTYMRFRVKGEVRIDPATGAPELNANGEPKRALTTISLSPTLVIEACKVLGSMASVGQFVRKVSDGYDPKNRVSKNRSVHVAKALQELVDRRGVSTGQNTTSLGSAPVSAPALAAAAVA